MFVLDYFLGINAFESRHLPSPPQGGNLFSTKSGFSYEVFFRGRIEVKKQILLQALVFCAYSGFLLGINAFQSRHLPDPPQGGNLFSTKSGFRLRGFFRCRIEVKNQILLQALVFVLAQDSFLGSTHLKVDTSLTLLKEGICLVIKSVKFQL